MPPEDFNNEESQFMEDLKELNLEDKIVLLLSMCSDEEIIRYAARARKLRQLLPERFKPKC